MTYVIIAAIVFVGVVLLGSVVWRTGRTDEIERFHRARQMTTEWARGSGPSEPAPSAPDDAVGPAHPVRSAREAE